MSNARHVPFETTLQVRDNCLCMHAQRAARTLARRFDEALRPAGLTSGQFSLLNALNRPEPPSIGAVAQLLAMDRTTLTAALKPLERDGLVSIAADPKDRRNRLVRLTDKGQGALAAAVPIWRGLHAAIEAGLQGVEPDNLRGALTALSQPMRP
jgi:DNA-binding MarR family transcriptional regulator